MRPDKDHEQFAHLIRALDPWLHEAVIVGGWAHRLYRYHELAQPLGYSPLMTVDADVALRSAATLGARDIRDRLLAHGFHEEFLGEAPASYLPEFRQSATEGFNRIVNVEQSFAQSLGDQREAAIPQESRARY